MNSVDICNTALAHLGDRRITALDAPSALTDALVRYCLEFYEPARQEALAAHRWTFAKQTAVLVEDDTVVTYGFTYAHTLPTDNLRLLRIIPGSEVLDANGDVESISYSGNKVDKFKIVGPNVWSNQKYAAIEYIRDFTDEDDPALWTAHFRAAVARLLAAYLAGPLTDNPQEVNAQMRLYETVALPNAQFYDAVQDNSNENSEHDVRLAGSPSLSARYTGWTGEAESDY